MYNICNSCKMNELRTCTWTYACGCIVSIAAVYTVYTVPPDVTTSDGVSNKPISMGYPVTISFAIVNEPVPNVTREGIQWVFSGIGGAVNLSCTSTSKYTFSDNCLSLIVSNAEGSDAGQYQIVITTEAGTGMSAVEISVHDCELDSMFLMGVQGSRLNSECIYLHTFCLSFAPCNLTCLLCPPHSSLSLSTL